MASRPTAHMEQTRPAPPTERTPPAAHTAQKLLDATHDLMVERSGQGASLSEICARAEVNVAMVKYCFGSKAGLLDALLARTLEQFSAELARLAAAELGPEVKLRRHVIAVVANYMRYPYVNRLMTERLLSSDPDGVRRIAEDFAQPARELHAALLREGRLEDGWRRIDPTLFFFSVTGLCEFLFSAAPLLRAAFDSELDPRLVERYGAHVAELVLSGVRGTGR